MREQFQNELNTLDDTNIQSESLKIDCKDLQESNILYIYPMSDMSLLVIDKSSDFINYDNIEDTNESTIEEK